MDERSFWDELDEEFNVLRKRRTKNARGTDAKHVGGEEVGGVLNVEIGVEKGKKKDGRKGKEKGKAKTKAKDMRKDERKEGSRPVAISHFAVVPRDTEHECASGSNEEATISQHHDESEWRQTAFIAILRFPESNQDEAQASLESAPALITRTPGHSLMREQSVASTAESAGPSAFSTPAPDLSIPREQSVASTVTSAGPSTAISTPIPGMCTRGTGHTPMKYSLEQLTPVTYPSSSPEVPMSARGVKRCRDESDLDTPVSVGSSPDAERAVVATPARFSPSTVPESTTSSVEAARVVKRRLMDCKRNFLEIHLPATQDREIRTPDSSGGDSPDTPAPSASEKLELKATAHVHTPMRQVLMFPFLAIVNMAVEGLREGVTKGEARAREEATHKTQKDGGAAKDSDAFSSKEGRDIAQSV